MSTYTFTKTPNYCDGKPLYLPDGVPGDKLGPLWEAHFKRSSDGKVFDYLYRLPLDDHGDPMSQSDWPGGNMWEAREFGS